MKVMVLGAGMYVTGRQGTGTGTILSSLCEMSRKGDVTSVTVYSRREASSVDVARASEAINAKLGTRLHVTHKALGENGPESLRHETEGYGAAIVSLPDHLHHPFARLLLEKGLPTLIVKPLAPTLEEARDLVALQMEKGTYGAVEFHKRWDETNLLAKRLLQSGELGDLLYCAVSYSQRVGIPLKTFAAWAAKTNIFQYLGVHYVDLFYFLTGALPKRVSAIGTEGVLRENGIASWDSVHATIVWEDTAGRDSIQQIACNWVDPEGTSALSDQKYHLVGTMGRLDIDQKHRGMEFVAAQGGVQSLNPYFSEYFPRDDGALAFKGYGHSSLAQFICDARALAAGQLKPEQLEGVRPTLREALVSTAVVDAANRSLRERGLWQEIRLA